MCKAAEFRRNREKAEETARRLSWSYPYVKASKVPAKVSVTELKRRYNEVVSEDVMKANVFGGKEHLEKIC